MCLDVAKRIQEMGRSRAHRRVRISLGRPADWRSSGEKFHSPRCGSSGEAKGERERTPGAIYRHIERSKRAGIKEELNAERIHCTGVTPA
jgi:hypothetical protein